MKFSWLWLSVILAALGLSRPALASVEFTIAADGGGYQVVIPVPANRVKLQSTPAVVQINGATEHAIADVDITHHMLWPDADGQPEFVRALIVTFPRPLSKNSVFALKFSARANEAIKPWSGGALNLADVIFSPDWLSASLYAPLRSTSNRPPDWFDYAYQQFGYRMADMESINQDPKIKRNFTTSAPWLYDRVYVLYQLYFKTGDLYFKHAARASAEIYRSYLNEFGYFSLKPGTDIKYLLSPGMLLDYQFYPSSQTRQVINQFFQNSSRWPEQYLPGHTFWTERNLSVALANAISEWEISHSSQSLQRVEQLLSGSKRMLEVAMKDNLNCLAHPYRVHEGRGDDVLVCSPWMNALLGHQLFKWWQLTGDEDAAELLMALATDVVERGTYQAPKGKIAGLTVPKYLVFASPSKFAEQMSHSDLQHACDVAGLLVTARFLSVQQQGDDGYFKDKMEALLLSCRAILGVDKKNHSWRVKPLRKFNWWFHSTGNLSWQLTQLDSVEHVNPVIGAGNK
ncbi:hypothetical protein [Thalassotalea mangrovi]|uniref:Alpha-L-rhamnosidase six-hairpin glycosidase domain-containing protein n=1 Tax=Thalassotalea mangrovi TaxID=2572245 RepID=A0A4U1B7V3_9GAMM|nr:hypothetical protein [Thalassotalea mangrovi]TKB46637.1 hypothetical protein E8M12_03535 [Thalassotalea mangrovi]